MSKRLDRSGRLRLIVQGAGRDDQPAGIRAAPPYLPETVWRLPGESIEQLAHRALQMAVGTGVVLVTMFYAEDVLH